MEAPFKVGDAVTTDYIKYEKAVVRRITRIWPSHSQSGWCVNATAEGLCPTCGHEIKSLDGLDADWFKKAVAKP